MDNTQQERQTLLPSTAITEAACPYSASQTDDAEKSKASCSDWLGRPIANDRADLLGGWKCSSCVLGAYGLGNFAISGILLNLALYLVQVCGFTNADAANTVTNISGTLFLFSILGAYVGDTYTGHFKAFLIFQILGLLSFASVSAAVLLISKGLATSMAKAYLLVSLYLVGITGGPVLSLGVVLGAGQLTTNKQKEKFFRLWSMSLSAGHLFSVTLVSWIDSKGMWVLGFGLCTMSAMAATMLLAALARFFRQYKASGNPFLRLVQVPVAAWTKRSLSLPTPDHNSSLLHPENQGSEASSISLYHQLKHASSLSFLDKAAVLGPTDADNRYNPWRLCTVSQVEEFKSFLRVIPGGIAIVLVHATWVQTGTLFEEQANLMHRQVTAWLVIPAASLNLFSFGSMILTGTIATTCGATLIKWCRPRRRVKESHGRSASTSLHLQSAALLCCTLVMVIAALLESHRLRAAQEGTILSVMWLVPQSLLVGIAYYLVSTGGTDFFYSEVADGMRAISSSIFFILQGAGSYLSSLLVTIVTAITTQGGKAGWIASDLNKGHLDYFYWLMACCVAVTLGIFLVYTHNYTKIRTNTFEEENVGSLQQSLKVDIMSRTYTTDM